MHCAARPHPCLRPALAHGQHLPVTCRCWRHVLCSGALSWHPHQRAPAECGGSLVKDQITELKQGSELPGFGGGLLFRVPCAPGRKQRQSSSVWALAWVWAGVQAQLPAHSFTSSRNSPHHSQAAVNKKVRKIFLFPL